MHQEDRFKFDPKAIQLSIAGIAVVGITTAVFILTPKISALIEYNALVVKINEIPANSQLKTIELRKQTIEEIKSLITS